jgi:hypothetical protein
VVFIVVVFVLMASISLVMDHFGIKLQLTRAYKEEIRLIVGEPSLPRQPL